jgi:hypothetical protein
MLLYSFIYKRFPIEIYIHIIEYCDANYSICSYNKKWSINQLFTCAYSTEFLYPPHPHFYYNDKCLTIITYYINHVIKTNIINKKMYSEVPDVNIMPIHILRVQTQTYVFKLIYYMNDIIQDNILYQIHIIDNKNDNHNIYLTLCPKLDEFSQRLTNLRYYL